MFASAVFSLGTVSVASPSFTNFVSRRVWLSRGFRPGPPGVGPCALPFSAALAVASSAVAAAPTSVAADESTSTGPIAPALLSSADGATLLGFDDDAGAAVVVAVAVAVAVVVAVAVAGAVAVAVAVADAGAPSDSAGTPAALGLAWGDAILRSDGLRNSITCSFA